MLVIQHDHVSPLGALQRRFEELGFACEEHLVVPEDRFHTPNVEPAFPPVEGYAAVVTMGAPWSTYDHSTIGSWVPAALDLVREADTHGIPVLGLCFGGQLLATAHGGSVARAPQGEVGWVDIETDEPDLVPEGPWFQWHFDRWQVPPGAREVARNEAASQGFVLRRNLAVQFHPELDSAMLAGWLGNGGSRILTELGLDEDAMVAQTAALEDDSRARALRLVDAFIERFIDGSVEASDPPGANGHET